MFPEEVLTKSKRGKIEVRALLDTGRFARYEYLDPRTGKRSENKYKLVLKTEKGGEEFFIIPVGSRFLMIPQKFEGARKVWDVKKRKVIMV